MYNGTLLYLDVSYDFIFMRFLLQVFSAAGYVSM